MEFKIVREEFLNGLSKVLGVVERKNTMPVLSNVLLDADKGGLKLSATDLEVAIVSNLPAQVINPGKITVLAKSLHDIVRELDVDEIRVSLKDNDRIEVKAKSSVFNIPGLKATEFPALPKVEAKSAELSCDVFRGMMEKVAFSMSTDETRYNLSGILLEKLPGGKLRMVATDGHRLSLIDRDLDVSSMAANKVIVPRKGVAELRKLAGQEGTFELAIGDKNLFARKGNETVYVRLIDGEFPDYNRVVPKDNNSVARIPRDKFVGALRRVSLLSNERSKGVVLAVSSGLAEISISNPDLGEAREEFDVDYKGEKIKAGFNARYFLDVLSVIAEDTVELAFKSDLAPCLVRSPKDAEFLSVVMPMRI